MEKLMEKFRIAATVALSDEMIDIRVGRSSATFELKGFDVAELAAIVRDQGEPIERRRGGRRVRKSV